MCGRNDKMFRCDFLWGGEEPKTRAVLRRLGRAAGGRSVGVDG